MKRAAHLSTRPKLNSIRVKRALMLLFFEDTAAEFVGRQFLNLIAPNSKPRLSCVKSSWNEKYCGYVILQRRE